MKKLVWVLLLVGILLSIIIILYWNHTFEKRGFFYCTEEERNNSYCTKQLDPVCALKNIQCITEPCSPIQETYSNSCLACAEPEVIGYTKGSCKL